MQIAVVGAGAMGRGIAQVSASAGHDVTIFDVIEGAAEKALTAIEENLRETVSRGKLTAEAADDAHARVEAVSALSELSHADIVIEAVVEKLDVKQKIFRALEDIVRPETVLASNTSSLAIGAIASQMRDRDRLIGLHFFNPVPAMRLVEIIARTSTPADTLEAARDFVAGLGKTGVVVSDSPGFLVNYAGRAFVTEALHVVRDSTATIAEVDLIAEEVLGFRLGPFRLMDLTGVDVNYPVTENIFAHNFADPRLASTWLHRHLLEIGNLGRKTGQGFYDYRKSSTPEVDPLVSDDVPTPTAAVMEVGVAVAGSEDLQSLLSGFDLKHVEESAADLVVVDPLGEDLLTYAKRCGLDARRLVGIDTLLPDPAILTIMVGPGTDPVALNGLVAQLAATTPVVVINDSPGFIAQRLVASIINLGCDIAQRAIATPADIDKAVTLGLRYPYGPLEWADHLGLERVLEISEGIHRSTDDPRFRPSAWLRRRAHAGLSAQHPEFVQR